MKNLDRIDLIKAIIQYHPDSDAGRNRGWSEYTGGMADTGRWFTEKMLDAPIHELRACLNALENPTPEEPSKFRSMRDFYEMTEFEMWYGKINKKTNE